jgi:hypothetical protein
MSIPNAAGQRAALRALVGHGQATTLLADASLDVYLDMARRQINDDYPRLGIAAFQTEANQSIYTVDLPENARRVRRVFYSENRAHDVEGLVSPFRRLDERGRWTLDAPGLVLAMTRNQKWLQFLNANSSATIQPPNQVVLAPTPTTGGADVYYTYSFDAYLTVADIPDTHYAAYLDYAQHLAHQALAGGAGAMTVVRSETGIEMRTRASLAHEEAAKRLLQRYMDRRPPLLPFRGQV